MITPNKRFLGILLAVAILLLMPLIAMQFSNEVKWNGFDFPVAGGLLLGAGIMCEIALRTVKTVTGRAIVLAMIMLGLLLVWAELAVGIFGTRFAGS